MTISHREICFETHSRECHLCGRTESLVVHHRDGVPTNDDPDNLIPLCQSCHKHVHNRNRRSEKMADLVSELGRGGKPNLDPREFDGVPINATLTAKETYEGLKYYYWQWRNDDKILSEYIAPVSDFQPTEAGGGGSQSEITEWASDA